ncbi:MAG: exonuclease SbcCD subunit D [Dehalococcoidia bacterium]
MRFLHTGDWHLGRTIHGLSRQPEFEKVLRQVVDVAKSEKVDVLLIAGDTFETFSPPPDAEKLLYETLAQLIAEGVQIVMIAGNHDHARRMDALTGVLRLAGIHTVGSPPQTKEETVITVPSRDGKESATIVALPWVPERQAVEFEKLFEASEEPLKRYADNLGRTIERICRVFDSTQGTVNVFMAHLLIDGVEIGGDSGERKLHIGQSFAIKPQSLPSNAQYVALGHVHRPQRMKAGAPSFYAGSLLQLDFGEAGQEKTLRVVDAHPKQPAQAEAIAVEGGRKLRNVTTTLAGLDSLADSCGDDYLRVTVELDAPVPSLYDRVREVLPNALDVTRRLPEEPAGETTSGVQRRGAAPDELFAAYYRTKMGAEVPEGLLDLFRRLQGEHEHAPA